MNYIGATQLYTDFVCGDAPLTEYLEPTPLVSIASSFFTSIPSSSQTSTSPTRTLAVPTYSGSPSKGLSAGQISGIVVGSIFAVLLTSSLLAWLCLRRNRKRPENVGPELQSFGSYPGKIDPSMPAVIGNSALTKPDTNAETEFEGTTTSGGLTAKKPETTLSVIDFENSIVFRLLCLYGDAGVPLRELVELLYLRYVLSQAEEFRFNYRQCSRSRMHMLPAEVSSSFVSDFLRAVTEPMKLLALEQKLVTSGVIRIIPNNKEYAGDRRLGQKQGLWAVDCRIWQSQTVVEDVDEDQKYFFLKGLLDVFDGMPDKTSHPLVERYREVYYNHGHAFLTHIESLYHKVTPELHLLGHRLFSLLLKILTHRHQDGDMALLYTAFDLSSKLPLHSYEWVLLRFAEVKSFAHSQKYRPIRSTEESVVKAILGDMHNLLKDQLTTADARDTAGYVLVEIINIAEVSQSLGILHASVETAEAWCQQALESAVLPEHSALSCVLVKLKSWSQLNSIPREGHLSCGYHLSRAGALEQAEQLLRSGLEDPSDKLIPINWSLQPANWRYDHELLTVIMRSGRWSEAQSRLTEMSELEYRVVKASNSSVMGDYSEFALSTACLMADCQVAKGLFHDAELLLSEHLDSIIDMRDEFIRTTRVAIESRLLNVQLQLPLPGDILRTTLLLWREVDKPDTFPLEPDTVECLVQELLTCVNRLISAEQYVPAKQIITEMRFNSHPILKTLYEGSDSYLTEKSLAIDVALANEQGLGKSVIDPKSKAEESSADQITAIADPDATKKDSSEKSAQKSTRMEPLTEDTQKVLSTPGEPKAKILQGGGRMQDPEKQPLWKLQRRKSLFKKTSIVPEGQRPSSLQHALNLLRLIQLESPPTNKPVAATREKDLKAKFMPWAQPDRIMEVA